MSKGKFIRVNEKIKFSPLLVVDESGNNIGTLDNYKARQMASERGLDLVEVNPNSRPPTCKIMDFGKHKYDLSQKEKANKSKQKKVELKEIRISVKIGEHDLQHKAKQARVFFSQGDKVRITMRLRGRENAFVSNAVEIFDKFSTFSGLDYESKPSKSGNILSANISGVINKDNYAETKDPQSNSKES